MKRTGNLFEKIVTKENFLLAARKAALGKRKKKSVQEALAHEEEVAKNLCEKFKTGAWRPNAVHRVKVINDGIQLKKREIVCPDFVNEQIAHHAIMNVLAPELMKRFYYYSCASIPGKGVEFALHYIGRALKDRRNTKYFVTLDIKQFFNSIRPSKVFRVMRRMIKDRKVLYLLAMILRANKVQRPDGEAIKRGTPIGLYTSPWFANTVLTPVDNSIKEAGVKYYIRYNDDMLLFHANKRKLKKTVQDVENQLQKIGLRLKRPPQIHRLAKVSIRFIGATIKQDRIVLQPKVFIRARHTAARIKRKGKITLYDARKILSYSGRFTHFAAYRAHKRYIANMVDLAVCRKIISKRSKCHVGKI